MITFNQTIKRRLKKKNKYKKKLYILNTAPMRSGTVVKVTTLPPRRPNSAKRKVVKVKIKNLFRKNPKDKSKKKSKYFEIFAYVPGIGHNLDVSNNVIIQGGNLQDTPNVQFNCIRGKKDLNGVKDRKSSRSKFGVKKENN